MAEVDPLSSWDMVLYGARVLLALVVVIPLLYYGLRIIGRRVTVSRSINGHIEILDVLHLGGGNQLLLVRVAARVLLLSVSKERTSLLWEGPEEEFELGARPTRKDRHLTCGSGLSDGGEDNGEMGMVTMARRGFIWLLFAILGLVFVYAWSVPAEAQVAPILPRISIGVEPAENPEDIAISLQILVLLTILALAPAILIMMTSFTRIVVVLSFVRNALATNQMPPNQVLIGLALFLTFYVMAPTWQVINETALQPYLQGEIAQTDALNRALEPTREFMFQNTREKDLELFVNLSRTPRPADPSEVPTHVLIPAFVVSELKQPFSWDLSSLCLSWL